MTTGIVGPIHLEDQDGHFVTDLVYAKHPFLRPFQFAYQGHWYEQNRCDGGTWTYRQRTQTMGGLADDPALEPMPAPEPVIVAEEPPVVETPEQEPVEMAAPIEVTPVVEPVAETIEEPPAPPEAA